MTRRIHARRARCVLLALVSAVTVFAAPCAASASTGSSHHSFKLHGVRDPYSRVAKT